MVSSGFEENQNYLLAENQELRNALEQLQHVLYDILRATQQDLSGQMTVIPKDILDMPFQSVSEDVLASFQDNLMRVKAFFEALTQSSNA